MSDAVIECRALSKCYDEGPAPVSVLEELDFSVNAGEMVAIIGASGVGKSTLLQLLGGLDTPSSGEVFVCGESVGEMGERERTALRHLCLGFVYQFHHLLAEFDVCENVMMPLLIRGGSHKAIREQAEHYLEAVGLSGRLKHRIQELSGGERQRVAIARALVTEPACVLADEPTGNLDEHTAEQVFALMQRLNTELHTSFVVVTHNVALAKRMQRAYALRDKSLALVTK